LINAPRHVRIRSKSAIKSSRGLSVERSGKVDEQQWDERGRRNWPPQWPDIDDPAVRAALAAVPRHLFVPPQYRDQAYEDIPLPIGEDQTISQPYIVAVMTQALRLTPASRVLEIGTGSGYQAAVLAQITPEVYSVEYRPNLAETATRRLQQLGYQVRVKVGDGCFGWAEHAPYDGIVVTAAGPIVPPYLVAQLTPHGRMVIPVGNSSWDQCLWLLERDGRRLHVRRIGEVRFVPLAGRPCPAQTGDPGLADIERQLRETFDY
jgi:protein-L-isoaspartate(D-aspartate) O-methyltransferase